MTFIAIGAKQKDEHDGRESLCGSHGAASRTGRCAAGL